MNRTVLSLALVAALVGGFTADGRAGDIGQCIKGAAGDYKDCKAGCKEDFQTAKDACINRDHDCVEACREVRAECRDATGFDAAIKACNATRDDAIANCKLIYPAGSSDRDTCIDDAQVNAFVCRLNERKIAKPALNQCRKGFKACTVACPAGVGTGEDPKSLPAQRDDGVQGLPRRLHGELPGRQGCLQEPGSRLRRELPRRPQRVQRSRAEPAGCRRRGLQGDPAGRHHGLQRRPDVHRAGARRGVPVPRSGA